MILIRPSFLLDFEEKKRLDVLLLKSSSNFSVNLHMYLLDTLHSRARLSFITDDDGVEFSHGLVPRLGEINVFVGLRELRLSWNSLLLLGGSERSAGPLLRYAIFFQGQSGLRKVP